MNQVRSNGPVVTLIIPKLLSPCTSRNLWSLITLVVLNTAMVINLVHGNLSRLKMVPFMVDLIKLKQNLLL